MNGGKQGDQNPRPLAGRTTDSRKQNGRPTRKGSNDMYMASLPPQSFGANAPPTWGLQQIGPPRGGPYWR